MKKKIIINSKNKHFYNISLEVDRQTDNLYPYQSDSQYRYNRFSYAY